MRPEVNPAVQSSDLDPADPVPEGWAVLDVREPAEWAAGHVAGSLHIPLAELPGRLADLPEADLLVVCRSGGRSQRAADWLSMNGWDAFNLAGGLFAWVRAGLPLTAEGPGAQPRVL